MQFTAGIFIWFGMISFLLTALSNFCHSKFYAYSTLTRFFWYHDNFFLIFFVILACDIELFVKSSLRFVIFKDRTYQNFLFRYEKAWSVCTCIQYSTCIGGILRHICCFTVHNTVLEKRCTMWRGALIDIAYCSFIIIANLCLDSWIFSLSNSRGISLSL